MTTMRDADEDDDNTNGVGGEGGTRGGAPRVVPPLLEDLLKETEITKLDVKEVEADFVSCYEGEENYRKYVLFLLFMIAVMQNFDRNVPSILFPTLAVELDMTDVDTGLVNGAFFLLVNCALAIPLARLADTRGRKGILIFCLLVWSLATCLSATAQSKEWLAFLRVGVGIGEAGCAPAALSLIACMYKPSERASAMAIQALGLAVGIALANVLGGILVDRIGWRSVFVMAGIPGFVLAGLVYFTLRDAPIVLKRSNSKANNEMTNEEKKNSNNNNNKSIAVKEFSRACSDAWGSVWECAKEMFQRKTFVYLAIACSLQVAVGLSILTFLPTFFIRSHGMSNQEAGVDIAVVSGACGALGILVGGFACDYLVKKYHDARWYLWFMIVCNFISTPLLVTAFLVSNKIASLVFAAFAVAFFMVMVGPPGAVVQILSPDSMRATSAALFQVVTNVFGGSVGPAVVGAVSDRLSDKYGEEKGLRYALAGSAVLCVLGQIAWFVASLTMRQDAKNAKEDAEQLLILKEDYFAHVNTPSREESMALLGGKNV